MKTLVLILLLPIAVIAQTPAKPEENARIKPLVAAQTAAQEKLVAKQAALPEKKAYDEAEAAFKKAAAALNKATEALPEYETWKLAGATTVREAFRILAAHQLSHLEYKPELNAKGELVFVPKPPQ